MSSNEIENIGFVPDEIKYHYTKDSIQIAHRPDDYYTQIWASNIIRPRKYKDDKINFIEESKMIYEGYINDINKLKTIVEQVKEVVKQINKLYKI